MATTSKRSVIVNYSGDLTLAQEFRAADSTNSPASSIGVLALAIGDNLINLATNAKSLTIIPPVGNTNAIKIKGAPADTGIRIHNTDPTSVAFDNTVAPVIYINLAAATNLTLVTT